VTVETLYVRNPAVAATEIDAETFLVEPCPSSKRMGRLSISG